MCIVHNFIADIWPIQVNLINAQISDTKAVNLDDSLLQTPSGKEYLVAEFTDTTVTQFVKALEVRRALIAKRTGKAAEAEEALTEVFL